MRDGLNVLSLFDGISCGMLALQRAGIPVREYHAFEIDKYAIQISEKNFPEIVHHGDVFDGDFTQFQGYDLLIGGSPCFTKGHYVLTDKGYREISEIKIGDMVLTHNGNYKPVVRTYQRKAETKKVDIVGFTSLITTGNHPFYSIKRKKADYREYMQTHSYRKFSKSPEWTKVDDMTTDTFCGKHTYIPEEDFETDDELLWILVRYIADGHLRLNRRKRRKNSYYYQTIISVGADKLDEFKEKVTKRHFSCYLHTKNVYRCVFSSKELCDLITENDFGRTAHEKKIPEKFMRLPIEKSKILLDGYLSGDSCFVPDSGMYTCSTISPVLALQIQRLVAHIYKTNTGFYVDSRQKEHYIYGRKINNNFPLYSVVFKKDRRKQSVYHVQNEIIWTPVKSVTPTNKTETVYNIEVADDNSYTVNNCIVHNCTYWSIAKNNREITPDGFGGKLFMQYVRALEESKCRYFLYENNYSIHKNIKNFISEKLDVKPIMINSALVSAQQRRRCYWTNIPNVVQPKDKKIVLADILESGLTLPENHQTNIAVPVVINDSYGKSQTIKAQYSNTSLANAVRNDRFGATMVAEPIRIGQFGKGGQGERIYSVHGKSVTLSANGGGGGAKTGLYKIDLPDGDYIIRKLTPVEAERLQTLPDNYTDEISNTRRYKCIGNGWTVDVIAHILKGLHSERSINDESESKLSVSEL